MRKRWRDMTPEDRLERSAAVSEAARKRWESMSSEEQAAFRRRMYEGQSRSVTRVPNMARAKYRKNGLSEEEIDYLMSLSPMERKQARLRQRDYGLKPMDYRDLVARQKGLCALCEAPITGKDCHVDHDHVRGHVRGLLCASCNLALGHLESKGMAWVGRAFAYVTPRTNPGVGTAWEAPIRSDAPRD